MCSFAQLNQIALNTRKNYVRICTHLVMSKMLALCQCEITSTFSHARSKVNFLSWFKVSKVVNLALTKSIVHLKRCHLNNPFVTKKFQIHLGSEYRPLEHWRIWLPNFLKFRFQMVSMEFLLVGEYLCLNRPCKWLTVFKW